MGEPLGRPLHPTQQLLCLSPLPPLLLALPSGVHREWTAIPRYVLESMELK